MPNQDDYQNQSNSQRRIEMIIENSTKPYRLQPTDSAKIKTPWDREIAHAWNNFVREFRQQNQNRQAAPPQLQRNRRLKIGLVAAVVLAAITSVFLSTYSTIKIDGVAHLTKARHEKDLPIITQLSTAGQHVFDESRTLWLRRGTIQIHHKFSTAIPDIEIFADDATIDIDLRRPTRFRIHSPSVLLEVLGTAFRFESRGANGRISLVRGKISILHKSTGKLIELAGQDKISFDSRGLRQLPKTKTNQPTLVIVTAHGQIFRGHVISENHEFLRMATDTGLETIRMSEITDRIDERYIIR